MHSGKLLLNMLAFELLLTGGMTARAQQTLASVGATSCQVVHTVPSEGDRLFQVGDYKNANKHYADALATNTNGRTAFTGLVRSLLAMNLPNDALATAASYTTEHPNDATAEAMMAAIHLRLGEVDDATAHVNHAVNLDKCNPWAHYEASLLLKLSGYFARAKTQMDTAHRLLPDEPSIAVAWQRMQVKDSAGCSMTTATEHTVLSMIPMDDVQSMRMSGADRMALKMIVDRATAEQAQHGSTATPPVQLQDRPFNAMGLRMQIQGKHAMLEVDTGASGITLTRTIAGTLGLKPLAATHMEGVGGEHAASGYWAHVSEITIGDVTFKNCTVEVISDDSRVRVDGLIGADIFREKLVTLDFPAHELQLDPLPLQPGSMATGAMDRYIAPEMQDWKDFYRAGHLIIVPTKIGDTPMKLFMMDSGAEVNAINPTSARLVSKMNVSDRGIKGISGTNNQVYRAKEVTLTFAGLQQTVENIMSFDTNGLSDNAGVEISGFIGFPALRHVVLKLDYRDNLMRVEYRPKTQ